MQKLYELFKISLSCWVIYWPKPTRIFPGIKYKKASDKKLNMQLT